MNTIFLKPICLLAHVVSKTPEIEMETAENSEIERYKLEKVFLCNDKLHTHIQPITTLLQ